MPGEACWRHVQKNHTNPKHQQGVTAFPHWRHFGLVFRYCHGFSRIPLRQRLKIPLPGLPVPGGPTVTPALGFIPDKLKSLCPGYVMGATLKKRNKAEIFCEEIRVPLGILHPGHSTGQLPISSPFFGALSWSREPATLLPKHHVRGFVLYSSTS